jgi:hypothetical protein
MVRAAQATYLADSDVVLFPGWLRTGMGRGG